MLIPLNEKLRIEFKALNSHQLNFALRRAEKCFDLKYNSFRLTSMDLLNWKPQFKKLELVD